MQEIQSIVEAWIVSKRLQGCRRSGATGSFYIPRTWQICILILHHHCIQYYNTKGHHFPAARMDVSFVHLLGQHICQGPTWPRRHAKRRKSSFWGKKVIRTLLSKGDYGMPSKTFQYHTLKKSNRNVANYGGLSCCHRESFAEMRVPLWSALPEQDEEFEEQRMLLGRLICSVHLPCLPPATGVRTSKMPWQLARFVLLQWIRIEFLRRVRRGMPLRGSTIESFSEHISQDTIFPVKCCHGQKKRKTGRASQVLFLRRYPHGCSSCKLMWMAHFWTKEPKF